jgi:hypothetical protein
VQQPRVLLAIPTQFKATQLVVAQAVWATQRSDPVVVHEHPDSLASWASHGLRGYYLGLALHHNRCHNVHVLKNWHPQNF